MPIVPLCWPRGRHDDIDAGIEFLETVRFLPAGIQEIERMIWASQKAIDAHTTEDREFDGGPPEWELVRLSVKW